MYKIIYVIISEQDPLFSTLSVRVCVCVYFGEHTCLRFLNITLHVPEIVWHSAEFHRDSWQQFCNILYPQSGEAPHLGEKTAAIEEIKNNENKPFRPRSRGILG